MFGIKYKPKNLTESLLPILIINWIIGHQIIQYPLGNFEFFQTIVYSIFALIIYGTCSYFSISCLHETEWFEYDFSNYLIIVSINGFISTAIIILGWINKNVS